MNKIIIHPLTTVSITKRIYIMASIRLKKAVIKNELSADQVTSAIRDKAIELSGDKFNPELFDNFMAALNAKCLDGKKERIEAFMKHRDYTRLGLTVMNAIITKLEEWSYEEAAGLYNSTLGGGDNE
jgi:hypothetical protein